MPRYPAIFIHPFKAGGTSVSDYLCKYYVDSISPTNSVSYLKEKKNRAPLIRGHVFAMDAPRGYKKLTIIRNPEAQLMSAIWHMMTHFSDNLNHLSFNKSRDLIKHVEEVWMSEKNSYNLTGQLYGSQSSFFAPPSQFPIMPDRALNILSRFNVVGITERMDDSLRIMAWRLCLPPPQIKYHARSSQAGQHPMPDEIRQMLLPQLTQDTLLYNRANDIFEKDFLRLVNLAGSDRHQDIDAFLMERYKKYKFYIRRVQLISKIKRVMAFGKYG